MAEATRWSLSASEIDSVGPAVLKQYHSFHSEFLAWETGSEPPAKRLRQRADGQFVSTTAPPSSEALEPKVLRFIDHMRQGDRTSEDLEKVLASIMFFRQSSMALHPRLRRCLKGSRRTRPKKSCMRLPEEIVAGFINLLFWWRLAAFGLKIGLSEYCYLRPGEAHALQVQDLVAPVGGDTPALNRWALIIAPQERGNLSKTGTFDDTVLVDFPLELGPAVGRLRSKRAGNELLFPISSADDLMVWSAVTSAFDIPAVRYQLRHTGASGDLLSRRRTEPEVGGRGRWQVSGDTRSRGRSRNCCRTCRRSSANTRGGLSATSTEFCQEEFSHAAWWVRSRPRSSENFRK